MLLIRKKQLCQELGVSPATAFRMVQDGRLPQPRKLGENSIAWLRSEIENFVNNLPVVNVDNVVPVAPGSKRGRKPSKAEGR